MNIHCSTCGALPSQGDKFCSAGALPPTVIAMPKRTPPHLRVSLLVICATASLVNCMAVVTPLAFGQGKKLMESSQPFGLKGDTLGETIEEFRSRNERTVQTPQNAKQPKAIHLPLCTNDRAEGSVLSTADIDDLMQTNEENRAGIVKCRVTLNRHENMDMFLNNGFGVDEASSISMSPPWQALALTRLSTTSSVASYIRFSRNCQPNITPPSAEHSSRNMVSPQ